MTEALIAAAERGAIVTAVFDKAAALGDETVMLAGELRALAASKVAVRLLEGEASSSEYEAVGRGRTGFRGLQHSKAVLVDDEAIIGSTNWTTASRANSEISLHVKAKYCLDANSLRRAFWRVVLRSEPYDEAIVVARQQAAARAMRQDAPSGSGARRRGQSCTQARA